MDWGTMALNNIAISSQNRIISNSKQSAKWKQKAALEQNAYTKAIEWLSFHQAKYISKSLNMRQYGKAPTRKR
jgi:hypothetical protein